ncbi:MAG: glycerophosphodiester phosphodiesterase [Alistipes sp.]|nr:glycerophosphodiester phosphodiesterase [Candidatus Alistipes equi]
MSAFFRRSITSLVFVFVFITAFAQLEQDHVIQFFAHRGSRFEYKDNENTMYAFKESYRKGARGYETDVRLTKDGSLILSHDESLYRTTGIDKQTENLTDEELRKIKTKGGQPLAFCQELVDFLEDKEGMYVEFEIKTVPELYTQAMLDELCDKLYKMAMAKRHPTSEYLFTSFDKRALQTMKRRHPEAILMMLKSKPCSADILMEAYDMGIMRVGCKMDGTTRRVIKLAHKLGMIVSLWPGSTKSDFFLGAALGCDAMCCDRFDEVGKFAKEKLPFIRLKGIVY